MSLGTHVCSRLSDGTKVILVRSSHQEAVELAKPARGVFGIHVAVSIGDFQPGDVLLACPALPLPPGNRGWGSCLVSVANELPALRQVFETAGGQWIIVGLDRGGSARFAGSVSSLAWRIRVVRQMPEVQAAPE